MTQVGTSIPLSTFVQGKYIGKDPKLVGQTGLIAPGFNGWVVQVDNIKSEYAFGWWDFLAEDWEPI